MGRWGVGGWKVGGGKVEGGRVRWEGEGGVREGGGGRWGREVGVGCGRWASSIRSTRSSIRLMPVFCGWLVGHAIGVLSEPSIRHVATWTIWIQDLPAPRTAGMKDVVVTDP